MRIIFDDVVYSLQKAGGISVMWAHITSSSPYESLHIQYDNAPNNVFSEKLNDHKYNNNT